MQQGLNDKANLFDQIVCFIDQMKEPSFYAKKIADIELLFVNSLQEPYQLANAILKKVLSFHKENQNLERIFTKHYVAKNIPSTSIEILKIISEYIGTYYPEELYSFESISIELLWHINKNKF